MSVLGHGHPAVTAAIHAQVDGSSRPARPWATRNRPSATRRLLAEFLPAPLDSIFFMNSGSEAIEAALKLARRVTGRPGIIAFQGGFHGRTIGAASITSSNINYRQGYEPLLPGVYLSPFPSVYREFAGDEERAVEVSLKHLRDLLATTIPPSAVAAMILEPVQGEGGYIPAPPAFLRALRAICDEHGILLIADEVQAGFGRTGKMWLFEHAGIVPDVVCMAKAIANGLPLSAIATSKALQLRWGKSAHGTTFGGNPVSCAAGIAVLETIRAERLVENSATRGAELMAGLRAIAANDPRIGDVRGLGLMIGVEFVRDPLHARAGRVTLRTRHPGLRRRGSAADLLRRRAQRDPLDRAAQRDPGGDHRGARRLRPGAARAPRARPDSEPSRAASRARTAASAGARLSPAAVAAARSRRSDPSATGGGCRPGRSSRPRAGNVDHRGGRRGRTGARRGLPGVSRC